MKRGEFAVESHHGAQNNCSWDFSDGAERIMHSDPKNHLGEPQQSTVRVFFFNSR